MSYLLQVYDAPVARSGEASTLPRLPEEKEETYMPDFSVGDPEFQDLLEWVDQPPPTQARDTHALHFVLEGMGRADRLIYAGLMFFHPGSPTAPNFEQQPGFSGLARPLLDTPNCQKLPPLVAPEERPDHHFVQVEVRFRPPQVFAALSFFQAAITGLPGEQVRSEEFDRVNIDVIPHPPTLEMDPPDGWRVAFSHKTNVLLGVP